MDRATNEIERILNVVAASRYRHPVLTQHADRRDSGRCQSCGVATLEEQVRLGQGDRTNSAPARPSAKNGQPVALEG